MLLKEKSKEKKQSLSLLAFESNENVISKILKSSVIQDGFSKAFVTVRSSLSIPNTQGDTLSFPSILFLIPSKPLQLPRSVLEKEEVVAWQHLQLLGAARPFYAHEKCSRCFTPHNRATLPVYRGVKLWGKIREGKSKQQMGSRPRHLYHQVMRRPYQKEEFCSDSGAEYITGYTQDMYHTSAPGHHSRALSSLYRLLPSTTLSCGCGCAAFPHRPRDTPAAMDTPLVPSGDLNVLFSPGWDKPAQPVTAPRVVNS